MEDHALLKKAPLLSAWSVIPIHLDLVERLKAIFKISRFGAQVVLINSSPKMESGHHSRDNQDVLLSKSIKVKRYVPFVYGKSVHVSSI